jgi:hypothetical protein
MHFIIFLTTIRIYRSNYAVKMGRGLMMQSSRVEPLVWESMWSEPGGKKNSTMADVS